MLTNGCGTIQYIAGWISGIYSSHFRAGHFLAYTIIGLYHSLIWPCVKWTYNVHIYITQNIGISKFEKHVTTSQFR